MRTRSRHGREGVRKEVAPVGRLSPRASALNSALLDMGYETRQRINGDGRALHLPDGISLAHRASAWMPYSVPGDTQTAARDSRSKLCSLRQGSTLVRADRRGAGRSLPRSARQRSLGTIEVYGQADRRGKEGGGHAAHRCAEQHRSSGRARTLSEAKA